MRHKKICPLTLLALPADCTALYHLDLQKQYPKAYQQIPDGFMPDENNWSELFFLSGLSCTGLSRAAIVAYKNTSPVPET